MKRPAVLVHFDFIATAFYTLFFHKIVVCHAAKRSTEQLHEEVSRSFKTLLRVASREYEKLFETTGNPHLQNEVLGNLIEEASPQKETSTMAAHQEMSTADLTQRSNGNEQRPTAIVLFTQHLDENGEGPSTLVVEYSGVDKNWLKRKYPEWHEELRSTNQKYKRAIDRILCEISASGTKIFDNATPSPLK
ncbi:unnamed protein product [Gongylonema pulchrum]|uniref:EXLDI protein n=1 Tax=Gongylonema pulchrum TaxID=637853 RepID=A0A183CUQ7_9BILA|nr:unnamed protein product [Gongylonema pulchrum]